MKRKQTARDGINSRLIQMLASQDKRRTDFQANYFSNFNYPTLVTLVNQTTPNFKITNEREPTTNFNNSAAQPFSSGVIPYNNFYITTMGFQPGTANTGVPTTVANCNGANTGAVQNIPTSYHGSSNGSVPCMPATYNTSNSTVHHSYIPSHQHHQEPQSTDSILLSPDNKSDDTGQLNPSAVSPSRFVQYAIEHAKDPGAPMANQFIQLRRTDCEQSTIKLINAKLSANYGIGIYSECPFLRPVTLLRCVQFAAPAVTCYQYPDPDNMVRTLRDQADQKVASIPLLAMLSGAKPTAASLGFQTDYLTHNFSLELDAAMLGFLAEQAKPNSHSRPDRYRVVLRLAWATTGLYMPRAMGGQNPSRSLAGEVLPRCLAVKVARRTVPLPDPIFHGGQAQKLGHRLKFSIDITDKIPFRQNASVRGEKSIDIEISWLHAPLEDHAIPLLELVGSGSCPPLVNHLVNLPLVQVTLDRVQTIPKFVLEFSTAVAGVQVPDTTEEEPRTRNQIPFPTPLALRGVYDFCSSTERVIPVQKSLAMLKAKLGSNDDLLCDDWIPISLLCPLTLTRIEVPVRSVNCDHLQCYDLHSYLTINKRRPRWSCPVCSSPAPFRDLRRDDFFVQVLSDKSLENVERVQVDAEGRCRKAREDSVIDSPAKEDWKQQSSNSRQNPHNLNVSSSQQQELAIPSSYKSEKRDPRSVTQGTPIPMDDDCVMLIDDDDDEDEERLVAAGTPTNPPFPSMPVAEHTLPTSLSSASSHRPGLVSNSVPAGPTPPPQQAAVTIVPADTSNMFVDLTTSSDEESTAPPPPPPTKPSKPPNAPPVKVQQQQQPPVVPPVVTVPKPVQLKPTPITTTHTTTTVNTIDNTQLPTPTLPFSSLTVSNQTPSTTMDINYSVIKGLNLPIPTSVAPKSTSLRPPILIAPNPRSNNSVPHLQNSTASTNNNNNNSEAAAVNDNNSDTSWKRISGGTGRFKFTMRRRCTSPMPEPKQLPTPLQTALPAIPASSAATPSGVSNGQLVTTIKPRTDVPTVRIRKRGRTRLYTDDDSDSTPSSSTEGPDVDGSSEEVSDNEDRSDRLWTPSRSKRSFSHVVSGSGRLRSSTTSSQRNRSTKS